MKEYIEKYKKYKNKYLQLKQQGGSKLPNNELCIAKAMSEYPYKTILSNGKECAYSARNIELKDYDKKVFFKGYNIVYRGFKINNLFTYTLKSLIDEFRNNGMCSFPVEMRKKFWCDRINGEEKNTIDIAANMSGVINVIHTTTDINVGIQFSVAESTGKYIGSGFLSCFNIKNNKGVYLPNIISSWNSEKEVAIPGLLLYDELLYIIEIKNNLPRSYWINEKNVEILNNVYGNFDEFVNKIIKYIILKEILGYSEIIPQIFEEQKISEEIIEKFNKENDIDEYSLKYNDIKILEYIKLLENNNIIKLNIEKIIY
jgi:hypothetical protein